MTCMMPPIRRPLVITVLSAHLFIVVVAMAGVAPAPGHRVHVIPRDSLQYNGAQVTTDNLHHYLEDHEKVLLFGQNKAQFTLANVIRSRRSQRSIVAESQNHSAVVHLTMPIVRRESSPRSTNVSSSSSHIDDIELQLNLSPSHGLIDDAFVFIKRYDNASVLIADNRQLSAKEFGACFYRGAQSALDLCEENVRGMVRHNDRIYLIHPLPERFGPGAHVIIDTRRHATAPSTAPSRSIRAEHKHAHDDDLVPACLAGDRSNSRSPPTDGSSHRRQRRFISAASRVPRVLHIETAVFVDKDLYRHMTKNYATDTESKLIRFVLAMINGVQLLYHHPSLGHEINFVLKRLEILHNDPKGLQRSSDIDVFLNSFCLWQKKFNPVSDADPVHYDHAVILTGLDLYVVGKNGKISSQVVGLAPVAGMCTATSSCTINEGKHFESVFVVAHEIGHNLGMRHDSAENNCDPSLFIMSPTLGSGKTTWSKCSRNYLKAFLSNHQARCMFDRGNFGSNLDHSAEGLLPGERFDADQQCLLKYGKNSVRSSTQQLAEVCRDLHCQRDRYTWTSHPSLEGTHCGDDMWCKAGACMSRHPKADADQTESIKLPATTLHIVTANSSKLMATKLPLSPPGESGDSSVLIDDITDVTADEATAANLVPAVADLSDRSMVANNNGSTAVDNGNNDNSADDDDDDQDDRGPVITNAHTSSYTPSTPLWSDWTPPSDCDSGCLFGESGRLREGSTGLRFRTRVCLDTRTTRPRSCLPGRARRYEACSSRQCYHVPRTTVLQFAQQVCERAGKFDKDIAPEGLQMHGSNASDSCRVWCRSRTAGAAPRTKSWTFPDGTACRVQRFDVDDVTMTTAREMRYCVAGVCEKFTCSNRTTNLFLADSIHCPEEWSGQQQHQQQQQQQQQNENSVLLERVRDWKSLSLKTAAAGLAAAGGSVVWNRADDRDSAPRTPVRRYKYAEPPLPPRQVASTALSSSTSLSSSASSSSSGRPYDVPFYSPNARSWRYKGVDTQRVGKYQRIPQHTDIPDRNPAESPPNRYTVTAADAFPPSSSGSDAGVSAPTFVPSSPPQSSSSSYTVSAPAAFSSAAEPPRTWRIRSGCHFGCMAHSKGIQIVESDTPDRKSNIQLCEPETIACDEIQTAAEYAQKLCYRYTQKVRGLSGHGTQILASASDPDRACKVACQDEYRPHRYYLVDGEQGHFPFGTKCAPLENDADDSRYCVNGKCLEFGVDNVPLQESHLSLALYRSRREVGLQKKALDSTPARRSRRVKRNFLYYSPINITERVTQELLQNIVDRLEFARRVNDMPILGEHIDFYNPVYYLERSDY